MPPRSATLWIALGCSVMSLAGAGCGSGKAYPVRGKVFVFETGLLPGGEIRFQSTSNSKLVGTGKINKDGTYTIAAKDSAEGLPEGTYRVAVHAAPGGKRPFHERFEDFDTSGLQFVVTARNENYFMVELKRGAN